MKPDFQTSLFVSAVGRTGVQNPQGPVLARMLLSPFDQNLHPPYLVGFLILHYLGDV